ncbi:MAG TPA: hypothetical protein VGL29_04460 [Blastocatellia bacterium]|jgi:hypothetical protein
MKNVCAEFTIELKTAFIVPPDAIHDDWGQFAKDPSNKYVGLLPLDDSDGSIELIVIDDDRFRVNVYGKYRTRL